VTVNSQMLGSERWGKGGCPERPFKRGPQRDKKRKIASGKKSRKGGRTASESVKVGKKKAGNAWGKRSETAV